MIEKIGKYRIDSTLGSGAMGVVYKAFDANIARVVALKTIRSELFDESQESELLVRFKNEAQASGRLNHPNIVSVFDFGESGNTTYIAMEFVDGAPLNTLLVAGTPMDLHATHLCMTQVLQALEYAHVRGVVHRDIKPANLLITTDGQVKITDFGIARIDTSTLTQIGSVIGTPSYMSPEQFRGETVDGRSDVFSAGVVLYQMLTGQRPFSGNATLVMHQILNETPANPSTFNPGLHLKFDAVVQRALAKRIEDRFPSAQSFYDALNDAYTAHTDGATLTQEDNDRTILAFQRKVDSGKSNPITRADLTHAPTQPTGSAFFALYPELADGLPDLQIALTAQIGPMAKLLLKNAAAQAVDIDDLCQKLLLHIPSESGRKQFSLQVQVLRKKLGLTSTSIGTRSMSTGFQLTQIRTTENQSKTQMPLAQSVLDLAELKLTPYVGPIAKILVRKFAKLTNQRSEFHRRLADNVPTENERIRFLHDVGEL